MLKIRYKMVYEFSQKIPITIEQDNVEVVPINGTADKRFSAMLSKIYESMVKK